MRARLSSFEPARVEALGVPVEVITAAGREPRPGVFDRPGGVLFGG